MRARNGLYGLVLLATTAYGCKVLNPGMCGSDSDCHDSAKPRCLQNQCMPPIGGAAGGAAGGAGGAAGGAGGAGGGKVPFTCAACKDRTPICDLDAGSCHACGSATACGDLDAGKPVCALDAGTLTGTCVGCLADTDCQGTTPVCELVGTPSVPSHTCRACANTNDCAQRDATKPVCVPATDAAAGPSAGTCVGCLTNGDCSGQTPICDPTSNTCARCGTDADCAGSPGVCMLDGHCAMSSEVIFVDESAGCPGPGTGTVSNPYCLLPTGAGNLARGMNVLIILGATGERLALATSGVNPIVIGRKNSAGTGGIIPAANGTGIAISSDTVTIRDLTVSGGLPSSNTKGIAITGAAQVSLSNVTINLTSGLGIDAEPGTTLTMTGCTVENNSGGGILLNEAAFDIENTTVKNNGPGTVLGAATIGGILVSNSTPISGTTKIASTTIANNAPPGLTCAAAITGIDILAFNNGSNQIAPTCNVSTCADAGPSCGAQP